MLAPLPDHIDILRLARQGSKLVGRQSLDGMVRLRQSVLLQDDIVNTDQKPVLKDVPQEHELQEDRDVGFANIELEFDEDDEHVLFIDGKAQASVYMTCQRCLEPMLVGLDARFLLGLVEDEAKADQLPKQYEPLVVSGKSSSLPGIIEDELILSLPLVAVHEVDQCPASTVVSNKASAQVEGDGQGNEKEEDKLNNPFSVLSTLKKKGKTER